MSLAKVKIKITVQRQKLKRKLKMTQKQHISKKSHLHMKRCPTDITSVLILPHRLFDITDKGGKAQEKVMKVRVCPNLCLTLRSCIYFRRGMYINATLKVLFLSFQIWPSASRVVLSFNPDFFNYIPLSRAFTLELC